MNDIFGAIETYLRQRNQPQFADGLVVSVQGGYALVAVSGQSGVVQAFCPPEIQLGPEERCLLIRLPTMSYWVVLMRLERSTYGTRYQHQNRLMRPEELTIHNMGSFAYVTWLPSEAEYYEVEVTENGEFQPYLLTRANACLVDLDVQNANRMLRCRGIAANGDFSDWSEPIALPMGFSVSLAGQRGDLITWDSNNQRYHLSLGQDNQVLTVDLSTPSGLKWADISSNGGGGSSPTQFPGDLIVRGETADIRLPVGGNNALLRVNLALPHKMEWRYGIDASEIISGQIPDARIANVSASKILYQLTSSQLPDILFSIHNNNTQWSYVRRHLDIRGLNNASVQIDEYGTSPVTVRVRINVPFPRFVSGSTTVDTYNTIAFVGSDGIDLALTQDTTNQRAVLTISGAGLQFPSGGPGSVFMRDADGQVISITPPYSSSSGLTLVYYGDGNPTFAEWRPALQFTPPDISGFVLASEPAASNGTVWRPITSFIQNVSTHGIVGLVNSQLSSISYAGPDKLLVSTSSSTAPFQWVNIASILESYAVTFPSGDRGSIFMRHSDNSVVAINPPSGDGVFVLHYDPNTTFGGYWSELPLPQSSAFGSLLVSDGTTYQNLPIGQDGQVLTVDTSEPLGVRWSTLSGNGGGGGDANLPELGFGTLLSANSNNELRVVPAASGNNQVLISDDTTETGLRWQTIGGLGSGSGITELNLNDDIILDSRPMLRLWTGEGLIMELIDEPDFNRVTLVIGNTRNNYQGVSWTDESDNFYYALATPWLQFSPGRNLLLNVINRSDPNNGMGVTQVVYDVNPEFWVPTEIGGYIGFGGRGEPYTWRLIQQSNPNALLVQYHDGDEWVTVHTFGAP